MNRAFSLVLVLAVLCAFPAVAQARGFTVQKVKAELTAADPESEATGKFILAAITAGDRGVEKLYVFARNLDTDTDYEVLLGETKGDAVSFGDMTVRGKRGYGYFRFRSNRHDYPEGVESLSEFSGENVFVVSDGETVLEGEIPKFVDPGTGDEAGEGSFAFGFGKEKLTSEVEDSWAFGLLSALAFKSSKGAMEQISLLAIGLDKDEEYGVFLTGEDGADDDKLGILEPRGRFGVALLFLSTRRDDELPAHLSALAGRTVEVRDSEGGVVLSGEFPSLK